MVTDKRGKREFMQEVLLFKLRANLSIASYLIKVGKGESADMRDLIKESHLLAKKVQQK